MDIDKAMNMNELGVGGGGAGAGTQLGQVAGGGEVLAGPGSVTQSIRGLHAAEPGRAGLLQPDAHSAYATLEVALAPPLLPRVSAGEAAALIQELDVLHHVQARNASQPPGYRHSTGPHGPGQPPQWEHSAATPTRPGGMASGDELYSIVADHQRRQKAQGHRLPMGFDSRGATGPVGQDTGRRGETQRQAAQRIAAGRRRAVDAFSYVQEQMAQVREMGRRMRTHRPSLRRMIAATDSQGPAWRAVGPLVAPGPESAKPQAWKLMVNRTAQNIHPLMGDTQSGFGTPLRFPAAHAGIRAAARVGQRGQDANGSLGRIQRRHGSVHDSSWHQDLDDFSELQIIAPNQRAVVSRLRQAKLAAQEASSRKYTRTQKGKVDHSAASPRLGGPAPARNEQASNPRSGYRLAVTQKAEGTQIDQLLIQADQARAVLPAANRSALLNDTSAQDALMKAALPQRSTEGELQKSAQAGMPGSLIRREDPAIAASKQNPTTYSEYAVTMEEESRAGTQPKWKTKGARAGIDKLIRPDLPSIDQFVHLNERTKLEIVEAKSKSPRMSHNGSRSRMHQPEASFTSVMSVTNHDYASSENAAKVEDPHSGMTRPEIEPQSRGNVFGIQSTKAQEQQTGHDDKDEGPETEIIEQGSSVGRVQLGLSSVKDNYTDSYQFEQSTPSHFPQVGQASKQNQGIQDNQDNDMNYNIDLGKESVGGETVKANPTDEPPAVSPEERMALMKVQEDGYVVSFPPEVPLPTDVYDYNNKVANPSSLASPQRRIMINQMSSGPSIAELTARANAQAGFFGFHQMNLKPNNQVAVKGKGVKRMPGVSPFRRTFKIEFVAENMTEEDDDRMDQKNRDSEVGLSQRRGMTGTFQPSGGEESIDATDPEYDLNDVSEDLTRQNWREVAEVDGRAGGSRSPARCVSKIHRLKKEGPIMDKSDPVYKIVKDRSIHYGKGGGGGGGKYLPGKRSSLGAQPRSPGRTKLKAGPPHRGLQTVQGTSFRGSKPDGRRFTNSPSDYSATQTNWNTRDAFIDIICGEEQRKATAGNATQEQHSFQQALTGAVNKYNVPKASNMPLQSARADMYFKPPGMQLSPLKYGSDRPADPNTFDPGLKHNTNGYLQDMVTSAHDSIFASKMMDKRDKLMKVIHNQFRSKQMKLKKGFDVANPAKRVKDHLRSRRNTKDILLGEFDSFKNWDTRIVLEEEGN